MRKLSLILSGPKDGCTYKREDFLPALEKIVEGKLGSSIVSFGPLARNTEWHLAVKDQNTKDRFMAAACLNVKGYSFRVRSADHTQFVVRVHWAPGSVPHEAIDTSLGLYGTVVTSANEQSTVAGFEGVATGIRSVVMSGNRDQIPHLLQVADPVTAENYKLLCVITGRKPLCLKCKHTGHYRRDCTKPYCRHHDAYGHDSEGCSAAKSYAAATRRDLRKQVDSSEYDTVSLTKPSPKMPRFAYKKARSCLLEPVMVKGGPSPSVESAAPVVALSESSSDGESTRWQVVGGRTKRKREGPTVVSKPPVLPPPSPATPNLEPLVIVEEDPDPKVLRTHSYFAVYWIGFHLRKYVPAFASLSIPHADYIPKYYNLALQMFRVFESKVPEFMFRQKVTTKFIYYHMLDNRKQPPRILKVYPTIDFNAVWKWIQCSFVDSKYRDFAWRVINET